MTTSARKILFVCGSLNQTMQMHKIASALPEHDPYFTPYFCDGALDVARRARLLEFTILGEKLRRRALQYLEDHRLPVDLEGRDRVYDLVVTCSDLIVPRSLRCSPIVLVQEGMTDPENWVYSLVHRFRFLPRWLCSTAATGLSDLYTMFCVASEGYRDLFIGKGVRPEKIAVTGIPNFDDCAQYRKNNFPHKHYVLVCTSDTRETWGREDRRGFIQQAVRIAHARPLIFKLHPNEHLDRATREIATYAPGALVYQDGSAEEMIANCDALITRYSSTVFVGLALGKEVYSAFDVEHLRTLTPAQNRRAAENIADVCRDILASESIAAAQRARKRSRTLTAHAATIQEVTTQSKEPLT